MAYAYLFLYDVYFVVLKLTVDSYLYYQKLKNAFMNACILILGTYTYFLLLFFVWRN